MNTSRDCNWSITLFKSFSYDAWICFPDGVRTDEMVSNCLHTLCKGPTHFPIRSIDLGRCKVSALTEDSLYCAIKMFPMQVTRLITSWFAFCVDKS